MHLNGFFFISQLKFTLVNSGMGTANNPFWGPDKVFFVSESLKRILEYDDIALGTWSTVIGMHVNKNTACFISLVSSTKINALLNRTKKKKNAFSKTNIKENVFLRYILNILKQNAFKFPFSYRQPCERSALEIVWLLPQRNQGMWYGTCET